MLNDRSQQLIKCLRDIGVQPHVFALFLSRFQKELGVNQSSKDELKFNLSKVLISQADIIQYHLDRGGIRLPSV
jgi:hypothetical protein